MRGRLLTAEVQIELELRDRERRERLRGYQSDILGYAREELKLELTPDQENILLSVQDNRRTAVKASHAIGKTFCAAIAANWWYDCWDQHICYITAPTWTQAVGLTFKQIKLMRRQRRLPGLIQETGRIRDEDKILEPGHFIQAINAEKGEGFQGEHTSPMLVILEEAVGVKPYIHDAVKGLMTSPENRILQIGNPTDEATDFGTACEDPKSMYNVISVSVFDHPNMAAELECREPPFPNAVRLIWLYEMLMTECEVVGESGGDAFEYWSLETIAAALNGTPIPKNPHPGRSVYLPNAVFQGRAMGMFPTMASEKVIPRNWLSRCLGGPGGGAGEGLSAAIFTGDLKPQVGADIARHGTDRTAIFGRIGPRVVKGREIRRMDLATITRTIKEVARDVGNTVGADPQSIDIAIDVTGGLGAGPADQLRADGWNVHAINSSSRARDSETYPNKRSELWFAARERARTHQLDLSGLEPDIRAKLVKELSTPSWKPDASGRKVVEPKEKTKEKNGSSPDLADGFNLAFYDVTNYASVGTEVEPFGGERW